MRIASSGSTCSVGQCSGCSDGFRLSGSTCPARNRPAATTTPDAATSHSAVRHGSGRYRVVCTLRPASREPEHRGRSCRRSSIGTPSTAGVVASSRPYTPTHTPHSPTSTSAPLSDTSRSGSMSVVRPWPRASIAAARRIERSSASVMTGTTTCRTMCVRDGSPPRSIRARRTRRALSTSCGATVSATVIDTPISCRRARRRLQAGASGSRARWPRRCTGSTSRAAARRRTRRAGPRARPGRRCGCPSAADGSGQLRETEQHVLAVLAVEHRAERDAHGDHDERRDHVAAEPRLQGASPRRAATTNATTAMIAPSSSGFVVRVAAVAMPSAQIHHAPGCSSRGSRSSAASWRRRACGQRACGPSRMPPCRGRHDRRRDDEAERRSSTATILAQVDRRAATPATAQRRSSADGGGARLDRGRLETVDDAAVVESGRWSARAAVGGDGVVDRGGRRDGRRRRGRRRGRRGGRRGLVEGGRGVEVQSLGLSVAGVDAGRQRAEERTAAAGARPRCDRARTTTPRTCREAASGCRRRRCCSTTIRRERRSSTTSRPTPVTCSRTDRWWAVPAMRQTKPGKRCAV